MKNIVKIGFLLPNSGIYPLMSAQIMGGWALPFQQLSATGKMPFTMQPEYIKQGERQSVIDAVNKLLHFDQVDILSGVIGYRIVPDVIPTIENRQKIGLFLDSGEYIPNTSQISSSIFYNSFQMWQTEYALGYWAQKQFGDKGSMVLSLYDSGYHIQSAFRQGTITAGSKVIDLTVVGHPSEQQLFSQHVQNYLQKMERNPPAYIHAVFCGSEATEFIAKYMASGLKQKVPLVVTSHMATEEILEPVQHLGGHVYAASLWNYRSDTPANKTFVNTYINTVGQKPNLFSLMGYEMGLLFKELLPYLERRDWDGFKKQLTDISIEGPRGRINFNPKNGFALPVIDIEKVILDKHNSKKMIVAQGKGLEYNDHVFSQIHSECVSGWHNPYYCV